MATTPRRRGLTLQEIGFYKVATPEQQAELDAAEAERVRLANVDLDAMLAASTGCRACGVGNAWGHRLGLCSACSQVVAALSAECAKTEVVNGHTRQEWCSRYLDREAT
jgi:hypothetical protein